MTIADQIRLVRQKIDQYCTDAGRQPEQVKLLAVSKTHPPSAIQDAYESGITEFGESYLQEAIEKVEQCKSLPIVWHFIGPLQSNKTRPIAENFDWVQSVDREKLLLRLNEQRPPELGPLRVCIQVNLFDEPQKKGAKLSELDHLLAIADKLPNIELRGLMIIPPHQAEFDKQLEQFRLARQQFERNRTRYPTLDTLSMGMSGDIQAAIFEGSTMVRVGTGIFGPRPAR